MAFFWPVTLGGKTLLPADNVFQWEPWRSYAEQVGIGTPHNALLSDLYLENYAWKRFIVQSLRSREIPLWNPYIFAGTPFLAAGQHSALYPLSVIFYVLPLPAAYGWFAALHLFLAGLFTYILARTLRLSRTGSTLAAIAFMFSGFIVIRNVFPMIVAAAVWLPLVLTSIERLIRRAEAGETFFVPYVPPLALGAVSLGMSFLAGHPEMYYYVALTSAAYALWRLASLIRRTRSWRLFGIATGALVLMALLGIGLAAAQWLPLLELVRHSFRTSGATFQEVLGWAYPPRRVIALLVPDFFGNPSHHAYLDLFTGRLVPVRVNALGEHIDTIYWGIKNYVEGASYVGTLTVVLATVAVFRRRGPRLGFLVLLAVLSLLFAFGSPLYILIYKLPGLNQVHSPFRWVYVYSLAMALLAGSGADSLSRTGDSGRRERVLRRVFDAVAFRGVPMAALIVGAGILAILVLSLIFREQAAGLCEQAIQRLALAPQAYADGRIFHAYQFRNLAIFGVALVLSGALLLLRRRLGRSGLWGALASLVLVAELFVIGRGFFPRVESGLVGYKTPAIAYLTADPELFRITTYVGAEDKTLNANAGMFYDLYDIRGYDSIIPKQYVEYMSLIQEQGELAYNRIAPLSARHPEALESPLLDLLNVKYVLTAKENTIAARGYSLVYEGEIRIYRNEEVLPRAFLVPQAEVIPDPEARRAALRHLDPRQVVILEEEPEGGLTQARPSEWNPRIEGITYTPNEVTISLQTPSAGFLVLGDSYFEDWLAFLRPADAVELELAEQALKIYRADGNFRAVQIPAGRHVVRLKYSPSSVKFGLYISFLAVTVLALALGLWIWLRFRRDSLDEMTVQRVTKNTVAPITMNVINKIIDMAFAMLMLRILGPVDAGQYYLAVVVVSWFDILTNFGLNLLVTREVSKDREHANRYLSNTIALRIGLWFASIPILALFFGARSIASPLQPATVLAISLFMIGLLPSNISASFSALFNAYERMEIPASVTVMTTLLKVTLGTVALVLHGGYVGLASVSIVVNLITMITLYYLVRAHLYRPRIELDLSFQRRMLVDSYPLMINLLLATVFFKVAVLLLEWLLKDGRVLGWYSTAYKYIDAVGLIPSYFTLAIFPLMSRYAATARDSLIKAYVLAIKLLLMVAVPGALIISALSTELISVLGGSQYLPYAAGILAVMIWYMPFGFINSVTQYVLIALEQQRFITRAFLLAVAFNIISNVVLIPWKGYIVSAYIAIASEIALLVPFYIGIRRHLTPLPWLQIVWRQAVAALPLALLLVLLPHRYALGGIVAGLLCYLVCIRLLRMFTAREWEAVRRVIPAGRLTGKLSALWQRYGLQRRHHRSDIVK
ncbi:MAG: oligosaccharide flippase family protein [Anaerolineae bacterium]|nr:oligosaccharide flippase family protein [Anaerolineae bacterium]